MKKKQIQKKQVRVRFAPSPTGLIHIGNIRTAIFNYLMAKKNGGTFILRIEDTDQKRKVNSSEKYIVDSLQWLGIIADESAQRGGAYGPYRQSERLSIYQKYIQQLIDEKKAYYAFDTEEEINSMRKKQERAGISAPKYNWKNRMAMKNSLSLPPKLVKKKLFEGVPYTVRFKIDPMATIRIKDLVRGWISVNARDLDDKILMKSDRYPTYHLASIADDYDMDVTHVIRGDEWLSSLGFHAFLYQAFGWKAPEFAHLPLILNPNGKGKLSKRFATQSNFPLHPLLWDGKKGFKEKGYLPEAMLNFLSFLGWNPGGKKEIFNREELISQFSLEKIRKSPICFDIDKANWFNKKHIQNMDNQKIADQFLFPHMGNPELFSKDYVEKVTALCKKRIFFLEQLWSVSSFFFKAPQFDFSLLTSSFLSSSIKKWFSFFIQKSKELPWDDISLENCLQEMLVFSSQSKKKLYACIRVVLQGEKKGPDLLGTMLLLGKKEVISRLRNAIDLS